jgi:hypothetical protein
VADGLGSNTKEGAVPASVRATISLLWMLVLVCGLTMVLAIVLRDDLVAAWRVGKSEELDPPAFVPVSITMFVVILMLAWVLAVMFRAGHEWARWSIVGLAVLIGFSAVVGLPLDLPLGFTVVCVAALLVDAALVVAVLHPRTHAFFRS